MEDIRGMPVCPKTGEENLYCVIQKRKEEAQELIEFLTKKVKEME